MCSGATVLNFDNTYRYQTFFHKPDYEWIDLSDIRSTDKYCEPESLSRIQQRLQKRQKRKFTLIGSGNYHYVTYLLSTEIGDPFSLVLFDNHTDMMDCLDSTLISCGSWVAFAITRLPMLEKVVIAGVRPDLPELIPSNLKHKVFVLVQTRYRFGDEESWAQAIIDEIPTDTVYISIDKDVLARPEAVTNWDHGNMKLGSMVYMLQYIARHKKIYGADICGEYPSSPLALFQPESRQAILKNERANRTILEAMDAII